MSTCKILIKAKVKKDDEFYTQLSDIQKELVHYKDQFYGKRVYLNCDNPVHSEFWTYFRYHFNEYGLKSLTATYLETEENATAYRYTYEDNVIKKTALEGNGDFRSPECIEILKESDIIVTNPPFSLYGDYFEMLVKYGKKYLIVGLTIESIRRSVVMEFMHDRVSTGYNFPSHFINEKGELKKCGRILWFTNLYTEKKYESIPLTEKYTPEKYVHFKNFDAINIEKINEIPYDYPGMMCVPMTLIERYNPEQFEIIGTTSSSAMPVKVRLGEEYVERYKQQGGKSLYFPNMQNVWYEDRKTGKVKVPFTKLIIRNKKLGEQYIQENFKNSIDE